jgi:hypothetical protein
MIPARTFIQSGRPVMNLNIYIFFCGKINSLKFKVSSFGFTVYGLWFFLYKILIDSQLDQIAKDAHYLTFEFLRVFEIMNRKTVKP